MTVQQAIVSFQMQRHGNQKLLHAASTQQAVISSTQLASAIISISILHQQSLLTSYKKQATSIMGQHLTRPTLGMDSEQHAQFRISEQLFEAIPNTTRTNSIEIAGEGAPASGNASDQHRTRAQQARQQMGNQQYIQSQQAGQQTGDGREIRQHPTTSNQQAEWQQTSQRMGQHHDNASLVSCSSSIRALTLIVLTQSTNAPTHVETRNKFVVLKKNDKIEEEVWAAMKRQEFQEAMAARMQQARRTN